VTARRVLVFFPQCPLPARSGAHRRCLEILEGLVEGGCVVRLVSTDTMDDGRWSDEGIEALRGMGVEPGAVWAGPTRWERRLSRWTSRWSAPKELLDDPGWTPRSLVRALDREISAFRPDAIVHNYVHWWRLADLYARRRIPAAIEMHDLVTLNRALRRKLSERLEPVPFPLGAQDPGLREDFYDDASLAADPAEFRRLGRFPVVSCISGVERDLVEARCPASRAVLVPMTRDVADSVPDASGAAVFPIGANPFNVQGLHLLARRILPELRRRVPDFAIRVTGAVPPDAPRAPGLEYAGYVDDLRGELRRSRFLASPVFGGTGEQVKVLEGLAAGIPAVVLQGPFQENAVADGEDGYSCQTVEAFVAACVRLWEDEGLRARMGSAALARIGGERSGASRRAAVETLLATLLEGTR